MRADEMRGLGDAELAERLEEGRRELFNLRFQAATHQLQNPSEIRKVRRRIARILTVMRERELIEAFGE